jgi:hypothetical protein
VGYLVFIGQNSKSIDGLPKWEHILGCFPILAALALVRHLPRSLCVVAGSLRCACLAQEPGSTEPSAGVAAQGVGAGRVPTVETGSVEASG